MVDVTKTLRQIGLLSELDDIYFMKEALSLAQSAFVENEVPIGAVVVRPDGEIIGRGYNQVECKKTQMAHAELQALQDATKNSESWRLEDCWMYVTLEPCTMCIGAIELSRLRGVVFASRSPKYGFQLDNRVTLSLYNKDTLLLKEGVCEQESTNLLKKFFEAKRKKSGSIKPQGLSKN